MRFCFSFLVLCCSVLLLAQAPRRFIPNEGQWRGDFDYKMQMPDGAVFLRSDGMTVSLLDRKALHYWHQLVHQHDDDEHQEKETLKGHAFHINFIGARKKLMATPRHIAETRYNYFLGNDPATWRSGVRGCGELRYNQVYAGVDMRYYFAADGSLKYDFIVQPGADVAQIKWQYDGLDSLAILDGALHLFTSVLTITEEKPVAYQINDGKWDTVVCNYAMEGDVVRFNLQDYDSTKSLVIDPKLVFSSFIGSSANNFGFTATYSAQGALYGGGVVFNDGGTYPTTTGAFRTGFLGPRVDVAISKFSGSGMRLLYSTFIGGSEDELPYSLIECSDGSLVVYGSTGSANFPVTQTAYQRSFAGGGPPAYFFRDEVFFPDGSDAFIIVLDSMGGTLKGSTYFGGTSNDGFNPFDHNYGDRFRGEVIVDSADNIYIVGSTSSIDLPVTPDGYIQSAPSGANGFAASFSPLLDSLRWATYIGGARGDNAIGIKLDPAQASVYIAGTTTSSDLKVSGDAYQPALAGSSDGYLAQLRATDGSFLSATYNGSPDRDANFFVEVDHSGDVYLLGQTRGNYPVSPSGGLFSVPGSGQYLHKFNAELTKSKASTVFGDGSHKRSNISPTAFMVDECKNLYLSGWGGSVNGASYGDQGWTRNLPITQDALQPTSDGSDFYFMVLDATWKELRYATYFGDAGLDHVDGGTSRFSPDGTIYQAVCAGCFGNSLWPTTPGAYSNQNYTWYGCNLAVLKLEFNLLEVKAVAEVDVDSGCVPFAAHLYENCKNEDTLYWITPQGTMVPGEAVDSLFISQAGIYDYKLVALDTNCGKSDTSTISIYAYEDDVVSDFTYTHDSCSNILKVDFINLSKNGVFYKWNFGDGRKSDNPSPTHYYTHGGDYDVRLINENPFCDEYDTTTQRISLKKRVNRDDFSIRQNPCEGGSLTLKAIGTDFQEYKWQLGQGVTLYGKQVSYQVEQKGPLSITLTLRDTLCHRYLQKDTIIDIIDASTYEPEMPNIFTPNGDGVNDFFELPDSGADEFWVASDMKIFNRWGGLLFHTTDVSIPWDGTSDGRKAMEGVYYYTMVLTNRCGVQKELRGFVHLMD